MVLSIGLPFKTEFDISFLNFYVVLFLQLWFAKHIFWYCITFNLFQNYPHQKIMIWKTFNLCNVYASHRVVTALLLAKPAIINDEDESGNSALHLAALNGHPKIIDILIDYGASVDPRNSVLWTPLDCAAAKGNVESVLKLLERDSPIDPIDLAYTTPLHLASREGHEAVVKALLEQGADPLLLDHAGKNALDMAIENSHKYVNFLF